MSSKLLFFKWFIQTLSVANGPILKNSVQYNIGFLKKAEEEEQKLAKICSRMCIFILENISMLYTSLYGFL